MPKTEPAGTRERDIVERRRAVRSVAERDVVEFDSALQLGPDATPAAILLRALIHDLAEHANRKRHFLVLVDHGDDLDERAGDPSGQHVEGDQRADRHRAVEDIERTEPDDRDAHQLFQKADHRLRDGRDLLDAETHGNRLGRAIVPNPALTRLERQRFDGAHPVNGFDEQRLSLAFGLIEGLQPPPERPDEQHDDEADESGKAENHKRELDAVENKDRQEHQERKAVEQRQEKPAGQELANAARLLHVLHEDAGRCLLEQRDRQVEEMSEGARRDPDVDLVGGVEQEIAPQEGEGGIEDKRDRDADGQDRQASHNSGGPAPCR